MTLPDVATLRLCSILASTSFGFVFVVLWLRNRKAIHFAMWGASSLIYGVGILLFALNPHGSLAFYTALYGLLGLTNVMPLAGVRLLEDRPPLRPWMAVCALTPALGHALPVWLLNAGWSQHHHTLQAVGDAGGLSVAIAWPGAMLAFGRGACDSVGRRMAGFAMLGYLPGYMISILGEFLLLPGIESLALTGMLSDQILLGVLNLGLLAIPIERVQKHLREAAFHDALTGCWNRAGLAMLAPSYLHNGAIVIVIDVDHFKQINDRYGHAAGDEVLVRIAQEARDLSAIFGGQAVRLGGDEFVILLPAASESLSPVATVLQHRLSAASMLGLGWSVSLGTAIVGYADASLSEPIARADTALYEAKASRPFNGGEKGVMFLPLAAQSRAAASSASR